MLYLLGIQDLKGEYAKYSLIGSPKANIIKAKLDEILKKYEDDCSTISTQLYDEILQFISGVEFGTICDIPKNIGNPHCKIYSSELVQNFKDIASDIVKKFLETKKIDEANSEMNGLVSSFKSNIQHNVISFYDQTVIYDEITKANYEIIKECSILGIPLSNFSAIPLSSVLSFLCEDIKNLISNNNDRRLTLIIKRLKHEIYNSRCMNYKKILDLLIILEKVKRGLIDFESYSKFKKDSLSTELQYLVSLLPFKKELGTKEKPNITIEKFRNRKEDKYRYQIVISYVDVDGKFVRITELVRGEGKEPLSFYKYLQKERESGVKIGCSKLYFGTDFNSSYKELYIEEADLSLFYRVTDDKIEDFEYLNHPYIKISKFSSFKAYKEKEKPLSRIEILYEFDGKIELSFYKYSKKDEEEKFIKEFEIRIEDGIFSFTLSKEADKQITIRKKRSNGKYFTQVLKQKGIVYIESEKVIEERIDDNLEDGIEGLKVINHNTNQNLCELPEEVTKDLITSTRESSIVNASNNKTKPIFNSSFFKKIYGSKEHPKVVTRYSSCDELEVTTSYIDDNGEYVVIKEEEVPIEFKERIIEERRQNLNIGYINTKETPDNCGIIRIEELGICVFYELDKENKINLEKQYPLLIYSTVINEKRYGSVEDFIGKKPCITEKKTTISDTEVSSEIFKNNERIVYITVDWNPNNIYSNFYIRKRYNIRVGKHLEEVFEKYEITLNKKGIYKIKKTLTTYGEKKRETVEYFETKRLEDVIEGVTSIKTPSFDEKDNIEEPSIISYVNTQYNQFDFDRAKQKIRRKRH